MLMSVLTILFAVSCNARHCNAEGLHMQETAGTGSQGRSNHPAPSQTETPNGGQQAGRSTTAYIERPLIRQVQYAMSLLIVANMYVSR